ncbi:MAG: ABC transporter permease [Candidatus Latescibacterota bacterium]|nr:MAG: ABC transporter permease [Candidatus Latescibacterota bacterium]
MKTILIIFRKELIDSVRDRRTLIAMIVVPLFLFPLLISISSNMLISQARKAQQKTLKIAVLPDAGADGSAAVFRQTLAERDDVTIIEGIGEDEGKTLVRSDSLDAVIVFDPDFDRMVTDLEPGVITMYYKSTESSEIEEGRVRRLLGGLEDELRAKRFEALELDLAIIDTVEINERNLASTKERLAQEIGGLLPYLIIIFCFMGSMYPAIDLAAGEKERGTLETLLTSPAGRMEILLGKFGVVVLTGLLTAVVSIFGMYLGIRLSNEIPPEILSAILNMLELHSVLLLLSLLLPLTVFFAAVLLSLSLFAKSFKEAQSIINPLMIVIIVPAFIGLMPGIELDTRTALIPILNVSLATKAIIAGTITPAILAEVYLSLIALAAVSLFYCKWVFGRESTIFRGT